MSLVQLFKTYHIPCEVQMIIQQFNIAKKEYDTVVHELQLQYNSGLWWLYQPHVSELCTCGCEDYMEVDKPNKVEFMTYDDAQEICEQAILLEELHNELQWGTSLLHNELQWGSSLLHNELQWGSSLLHNEL